MSDKLPKALYYGKLPIGNIELDCYVLDDKNNTRIISQKSVFTAFGRPPRGRREKDPIINHSKLGVIQLPSFIGGNNLVPYVDNDLLGVIRRVDFMDGNTQLSGYNATILPKLCKMYVEASNEGALKSSQKKLARQADILRNGFSEVGIIALIDEVTGFQIKRPSDALRFILQAYLSDGIRKWLKEFPDDFFIELDRLYGNDNLKSNKRPMYYGKFINKYVYEPIENGKVNPELHKRYKLDKKKNRKFQHLTEFGINQIRIQIGKVLGLMQVSPNLNWFKQKQNRQGQLSLFPDFD